MLITNRTLSCCMVSSDQCVEPAPQTIGFQAESVVHERPLTLDPRAVIGPPERTVGPAVKELLGKLHSALVTSWRATQRRPAGATGFLGTDHFTQRIAAALPPERLNRLLGQLSGIPDAVVQAFGPEATVAAVVAPGLQELAERTGLSISDAAEARLTVLRAGE